MNKTRLELKIEADRILKDGGHELGGWKNFDENRSEQRCATCGRYIQVNSNPAPNEIEIGGNAVALSCALMPRVFRFDGGTLIFHKDYGPYLDYGDKVMLPIGERQVEFIVSDRWERYDGDLDVWVRQEDNNE